MRRPTSCVSAAFAAVVAATVLCVVAVAGNPVARCTLTGAAQAGHMSSFSRSSAVAPAVEIMELDEHNYPAGRFGIDAWVRPPPDNYAAAAQPWLLENPFGSAMHRRNATLGPVAQWGLWAAAAFADHLSGKYGVQPARKMGVLWIESVTARAQGYAAALDGSRRSSPESNPVGFDFRDGEAKRPFELGVLQEVRLVVWRCRRPRPERLTVRFFTSPRTLTRGLLTLIAVPVRVNSLSHAEAAAVRDREETYTSGALCDSATKPKGTKAAATSAPSSAINAHHHLRVMSYNIWNFNDPWLARCNAIAKVVRGEAPDAVLFQEVRVDADGPMQPSPLTRHPLAASASNDTAMHPEIRSGKEYFRHSKLQSEHLLRHIRGKLPYWFDALPAMTYRPEMDFSGGRRNGFPHSLAEGPMIAHKLRTLGAFPLFLPRTGDSPDGVHEDGDDHQRMALCHAVAVPVPSSIAAAKQIRVDLCTTHFSLSSKAQMLNARSASEQMASLADVELDGMKTSHTVFAGDLNAEPDSDTIRWLVQQQPQPNAADGDGGAGFVDAFDTMQQLKYPVDDSDPCVQHRQRRAAALGGEAAVERERDADGMGPAGFTFNNLEEELVKRIDFVLTRPGPAGRGTQLCPVAMRHRGHRTEAGFSPSDHLAVTVDYAVVPAAAAVAPAKRPPRDPPPASDEL